MAFSLLTMPVFLWAVLCILLSDEDSLLLIPKNSQREFVACWVVGNWTDNGTDWGFWFLFRRVLGVLIFNIQMMNVPIAHSSQAVETRASVLSFIHTDSSSSQCLSFFQCYYLYCTNVLLCIASWQMKPPKLINSVCFQDAEELYMAALAHLLVPAIQQLTTTTLIVSGPLLCPRDELSEWTLISSASMTQGIAVATIWSFTMGQMPAIPPPGRTVGWYVLATVCAPLSGYNEPSLFHMNMNLYSFPNSDMNST